MEPRAGKRLLLPSIPSLIEKVSLQERRDF
jgi:hypothetical protein